MKTDLLGLKKGDVIVAKVSERLSDYEYIVSIDGSLIQVQNLTLRNFEVGAAVHLAVTGTRPLQLKLLEGKQRSRRGLDLSV